MLIDEYLPEYDVTVSRHAIVEADPETTYRAALSADLLDTGPLVRALGWLRVAPTAVLERARGKQPKPMPDRFTVADLGETEEWVQLDEEPDEEVVFGSVGRFWRPDIEWRPVEADEFADFGESGYGKVALNLSVRPYGEGRTLLSYEARTATTDADSRRRFRRYWRLVGPFAGYLMTKALERIAADAEELSRASGARSRLNSATAEWSFLTTGRLTVSVCLHSTTTARWRPSTTSSSKMSRPSPAERVDWRTFS